MMESVSFFLSQGVRHETDEERSFFPRLRGRVPKELLQSLSSEHQAHAAMANDLDALLAEAPGTDGQKIATLAAELAAAYRGHIAREESALWPEIEKVLSPEELEQARQEMQARRGR